MDYVLDATGRKDTPEAIASRLISDFGLSEADAELAIDRALGGVVRAATGNPENCPKREKDPVAWTSYQKCLKRPDLIARVYPKFEVAARKPWWRRLLS